MANRTLRTYVCMYDSTIAMAVIITIVVLTLKFIQACMHIHSCTCTILYRCIACYPI